MREKKKAFIVAFWGWWMGMGPWDLPDFIPRTRSSQSCSLGMRLCYTQNYMTVRWQRSASFPGHPHSSVHISIRVCLHQVAQASPVFVSWFAFNIYVFIANQKKKKKQGRPRKMTIWGLLSNAALFCISWYQEVGNLHLCSFQNELWFITSRGKVTGTFSSILGMLLNCNCNYNINMRDFLYIVLSWGTQTQSAVITSAAIEPWLL